jgi:hypothetical protein
LSLLRPVMQYWVKWTKWLPMQLNKIKLENDIFVFQNKSLCWSNLIIEMHLPMCICLSAYIEYLIDWHLVWQWHCDMIIINCNCEYSASSWKMQNYVLNLVLFKKDFRINVHLFQIKASKLINPKLPWLALIVGVYGFKKENYCAK